ncbi:hypothetical protein [Deinococcus sp.]|uniref:hypothetical protein n=1 Tax=Deinococcus sp. TaxID=47478 RepID=UPI00286989EE|nr:hypothetical protein [Deinococcus sp.]
MTVDWKALKREARSKNTSAARLIELAAIDPKLSREIAKNQHTPLPVLERLARSTDVHTRKAVVYHPAITPAVLETLSSDRQWTVLRAVAGHPLTPGKALNHLAEHPQGTIRVDVVRNPQTAPSIRERLATDPNPEVRGAVAPSGALPTAVVQRLLDDPEPWVRGAALSNPQTGFERRLLALDDGDDGVRSYALWLLKDEASANHVIAYEVLDRLVQDASAEMRESAAMYVRWGLPKSPERDVLADRLSADEDENVRFHAECILKGDRP